MQITHLWTFASKTNSLNIFNYIPTSLHAHLLSFFFSNFSKLTIIIESTDSISRDERDSP